MNKTIRKILERLFDLFGYRIINKSYETVSVEHFSILAKAYEQEFGKTKCYHIKPDENRIRLLPKLLGTPVPKAYFIIHSIIKTFNAEGDICEFGVAQGATSALIANEILTENRKFHLFDSFEGLPKPSEKDKLKDDVLDLGSINAYHGTMSFREKNVLNRLREVGFPSERTIIHRGFIDKVIKSDSNLPQRVSFAYVDFDFYEPIRDALIFLDKTMTSEGIIIIDDYDYFSTGAKTAVDEFMNDIEKKEKYTFEVPDKRYGHFAILTKKTIS